MCSSSGGKGNIIIRCKKKRCVSTKTLTEEREKDGCRSGVWGEKRDAGGVRKPSSPSIEKKSLRKKGSRVRYSRGEKGREKPRKEGGGVSCTEKTFRKGMWGGDGPVRRGERGSKGKENGVEKRFKVVQQGERVVKTWGKIVNPLIQKERGTPLDGKRGTTKGKVGLWITEEKVNRRARSS